VCFFLSMPISLEKFARTVTPAALRPYFEAKEIEVSVDWEANEKSGARQVIDAVYALADPVRSQVLIDFERGDEMANEVGQNALLAAVTSRMALSKPFATMGSPRERALWVFYTDQAAFERAEDARHRLRLAGPHLGWLCHPAGLRDQSVRGCEARLRAINSRTSRAARRLRAHGEGRDLRIVPASEAVVSIRWFRSWPM
jgi:hypothetical protein